MSAKGYTAAVDCHFHLRASAGISDAMRLLDECGIAKVNALCTAGTLERGLGNNCFALLWKAVHPRRVFVFGGLRYCKPEETTPEGLRRQAEQLWEAGCDGIKMIEGKPTSRKRIGFALDAPAYEQYYAFLESQGIPLLFHVADPETFWDPERIPAGVKGGAWDYTDGTFPNKEQLYGETERVLEMFPKLRVIFAHFYFLANFPDRASSFLDRWPEVSLDITPGVEMYRSFSRAPDRWREFFTVHQDRILFGTDNSTPSDSQPDRHRSMIEKVQLMGRFLETRDEFEGFGAAQDEMLMGLGLDDEALEKIYWRNFVRYAGKEPRPLRSGLAIRQCQQAIECCADSAEHAELRSELEEVAERLQC